MKKHIKLFVFIATLLLVFGIYNLLKGNSEKINYIALGDSVAEGMNPYGAVGYGYPDYVKDELLKNEKLKFYTKGFSKSGYTIENVKNDIENNKIIIVDDKKVSIKQSLRESDVVTISIGANDFIRGLSLSNFSETVNNVKDSKKNIDKIYSEYPEGDARTDALLQKGGTSIWAALLYFGIVLLLSSLVINLAGPGFVQYAMAMAGY